MPAFLCPRCDGDLIPCYSGGNDPWPRPIPGAWYCEACEDITLEDAFEEDIEADHILERRRDSARD